MEGDLQRKSLRGSKEQSKLTQNTLLFIIHLKIFPDHLHPHSQGAAQEAEITHMKYEKNGLICTTLLNIPHIVMHIALWKGGPVRADLGKVPETGGRNMNGHLERRACQV